MNDETYKKPTRDELRRMSRADPEYNNPVTEQGKRRKRLREENERAGEPVLEELRACGFNVEEVDDLKCIQDPKVLPILLWWLPRVENLAVKETIVRALSMKWAKPEAQHPLIDEFKRATDESLKWAIGNALEVIEDNRIADDILELVQVKQHGTSRQMMILGMWKIKDPRVADVAINLLQDDDVVVHALSVVGRLKPRKAWPYVEKLLSHPKAPIRKKALQVLQKLDKSGN